MFESTRAKVGAALTGAALLLPAVGCREYDLSVADPNQEAVRTSFLHYIDSVHQLDIEPHSELRPVLTDAVDHHQLSQSFGKYVSEQRALLRKANERLEALEGVVKAYQQHHDGHDDGELPRGPQNSNETPHYWQLIRDGKHRSLSFEP